MPVERYRSNNNKIYTFFVNRLSEAADGMPGVAVYSSRMQKGKFQFCRKVNCTTKKQSQSNASVSRLKCLYKCNDENANAYTE